MNIYFSGIGGVGIGPMALIARDCGYRVSGSDIKESRYTQIISDKGIDVSIGQDGKAIADLHNNEPIDWFVYSAALPKDNPELTFAKNNGIRCSLRSDLLNHILEDKDLKLIAVSGTHGKTTTTGMLVWALDRLGIPASYAIGTNISFGPSGKYRAGSKFFFYEADEYKRQFLELNPELSIVTNIEHDHPDTYPTANDYYKVFEEFILKTKSSVVGWQEDISLTGLSNEKITEFNKSIVDKSGLTLPGLHNRQNAFLALESIKQLFGDEIAPDAIEALNSFPGTERRFEKLVDGVYTDYGHHPTEIRATCQMALEMSDSVTIVYQPHQNMRQHEIVRSGGYGDALEGAEKVYWLPTYLSREDKSLETLTPEQLANTTTVPEIIESADMNQALLKNISDAKNSGSTVVLITAGDADQWLRQSLSN